MPGALLAPSGLLDQGGGWEAGDREISELEKNQEAFCGEEKMEEGGCREGGRVFSWGPGRNSEGSSDFRDEGRPGMRMSGRRAVKAEGVACAKGLGQDHAWRAGGTAGRPVWLEQREKGDRGRREGGEGTGQVVWGLGDGDASQRVPGEWGPLPGLTRVAPLSLCHLAPSGVRPSDGPVPALHETSRSLNIAD